MKITVFLFVLFVLLFILLFRFFYNENKKEDEKDSIMVLIFAAALFSLFITIVIAVFLFLIIGSTSAINLILSLNISTEQIMIIGISFLIYLFTIDHIIEIITEYLLGKNIFHYIVLAFTRISSFYIIGIIINIRHDINITISIGVSLILLLFEVLYFYRKSNEAGV